MFTALDDLVARLLVRVSADQTPRIRRHCPRCAMDRDFTSSGKFRVNAQKKIIDSWLIFRCSDCDCRWNLPVHERRPVRTIDPDELAALMRNDGALADRYAAAASRASSNAAIAVFVLAPVHPDTRVIEMAIAVAASCSVRLDRLLALVLGLRRDAIQPLYDRAAITIRPVSAKPMRRSATDGQMIRLDLARCPNDLALRCRASLVERWLNTHVSDPPG